MSAFSILRRHGTGRTMLAADIGCVMHPVSEYGFYLTVPRDLQRDRTRTHPDLLEALEKSAKQFEFYAREHHAKAAAATTSGPTVASLEKAATNEDFARMCRAAIEKATKP